MLNDRVSISHAQYAGANHDASTSNRCSSIRSMRPLRCDTQSGRVMCSYLPTKQLSRLLVDDDRSCLQLLTTFLYRSEGTATSIATVQQLSTALVSFQEQKQCCDCDDSVRREPSSVGGPLQDGRSRSLDIAEQPAPGSAAYSILVYRSVCNAPQNLHSRSLSCAPRQQSICPAGMLTSAVFDLG